MFKLILMLIKARNKKDLEHLYYEGRHYVRSTHPQRKIWTVLRHMFLVGIGFVILYPILDMISSSIKPYSENFMPQVIWIPISPTLENYREALVRLDLKTLIKPILSVTLLTTIFQVVISLIVGYGFARFNFKGNKLLFGLVIITIIVPAQTLSTSLYSSFRYFDLFGIVNFLGIQTPNLIGTPWVSWLPALMGVGLRSGLYIYMYRQYFMGIPKELEEASSIDGCGPFSTFLRIMLPNTKNIIITVFLFSLVWNWNDYYTPAMYMQNQMTLAKALAEIQNSMLVVIGDTQFAPILIKTVALIAIAPLIIIYMFTQKYFTESIENTGITGT